MKNTKLFISLIVVFCALIGVSCEQSPKWDGTWSSSEGSIVVTLDSSTMKAQIQLFNGEVSYTANWAEIDENSIVWEDYASNQYTMMTSDGHLCGFNAITHQRTDKQIVMRRLRSKE